MAVPLDALAEDVRTPCAHLRDEVRAVMRDELVALWAYGAATRPDRPKRPGDVDTYGVLSSPPDRQTAARLDELHRRIAFDARIEWDSWYILEADARRAPPPRHAFREELVDGSWSLQRAHWLAGGYVALHGCAPADLVMPPTWSELMDGLRSELAFITRFLDKGRDDLGHGSYAVSNACRIIFSLENRDVVVSKRAAGLWGLAHLPAAWHAAIGAAIRAYDGEAADGDADVLRSATRMIVEAARERLATSTP